ncbi:carboxypeptidase-like regulatory domain-containing protein [Bacteroides sp. CR5/BHMF/2]|nr:carboxypeptidase-like regulatory domain-containing protein [Bacteroides sp. CR5/BHMF/2]
MVYICCFSLTIFAQNHFVVSGKVIGADKEPIIGATIQDKTNNIGVISDINGNFSIKASSRNATLHVSYIGMKSMEVKVEGRSTLTIVLEENTVKIDEVVVTALGIKRKRKL